MQNMDLYYDFSGQKFGYPLSLSINGFSRNTFSRQSSLEISYVLKGEYEAVTTEFSYGLKEQDMIVIAPYDIHMLHKKKPEDPGLILTIHIDLTRMSDAMAGSVRDGFSTAICTKEHNPKTYLQLKRKIGEILEELIENRYDLYHMNVLMMEIIQIAAARNSFSVDDLPLHTDYHENYMKAIKYIDSHYKENLTLTRIAKELSFSVSYTSKLLKKYTGIPFVKYLSYVRVRASLEKILEGRESIEKIASDYGLPSSKAYTQVFRELYGIVPSIYRKQFQNNQKYNEKNEEQKMVLDEEQKKLLRHLVKESEEILYDDGPVQIRKTKKELVIQIKDGQITMEPSADGGMIIKRLLF